MNKDIIDSNYLKTLTILYVEDEDDLFMATVPVLARYCAKLLTARNGAEGLDVFTSQVPDIIVTDIQMPTMDGLTMAEQIRVLDRSVPIVMVTAFERLDYLIRAIDAHIDTYVRKPMSIKQLFESLLTCAHRLRVERQLQESEERFRQCFEFSAEASFMLDAQEQIAQWNVAASHLLGYNRTEVAERKFSDLLAPHCISTYRAAIRHFLSIGLDTPKNKTIELSVVRKDGQDIAIELSLAVHRPGSAWHLIGIIRDITVRKKLEEQLHKSHDLLMSLGRHLPGMIFQYRIFPDGNSCFPYASDAIRDIFDLTPKQVEEDATSFFTMLHPEDYSMFVAAIAESARTFRPLIHEFRVVRAKKGIRWLTSTAQPEQLPDGSIQWHGFVTDSTETKHRETDGVDV